MLLSTFFPLLHSSTVFWVVWSTTGIIRLCSQTILKCSISALDDIIFPCSYPYLTLLSSLVSCAAHFAFKLDQSLRSLFLSSITDSRNLTILLGRLELNCAWILVIVSRAERFFLAIYCESNILHPLETSENIAIPEDITIFLRYFL